MSDLVLDQVKELMTNLTPLEKAELVAWLGGSLKAELPRGSSAPRQSARGLWADLGTACKVETTVHVTLPLSTNVASEGK